jgi:hypothetical protein
LSDILHRLSSARGERKQSSNKALATEVASASDAEAVAELVGLLAAPDKSIRTDAIKVLGEIAGQNASLLVDHASVIGTLLASASGVLLWEGLTVLDGIANVDPDPIRPFQETVIAATGSESVIARDKAVRILVKLATGQSYQAIMPALLDVLRTAPVNQLPTYAEWICGIVRESDGEPATEILERRLASIDQPAKVRRVQKAIRSIKSREAES